LGRMGEGNKSQNGGMVEELTPEQRATALAVISTWKSRIKIAGAVEKVDIFATAIRRNSWLGGIIRCAYVF
jgi:hypothetical protein